MNRMPVAAIMYDFDRTLCTKDMQDYSFIPRLNMTEDEFWKFSNELGQSEHMDSILAYMYAMVKMSRERNMPLLRNDLVEMGKNVEFFDGVKDWFKRISDFGEKLGMQVEHYVISSGMKEIIEGTEISKNFKSIFACEFLYDENGNAVWPKTDVNYTNKTQFVYRINKGVLDVANDVDLNRSMPEDSKRVPFCNMIYIGDSDTDVPCMKLVSSHGGYSIGVYSEKSEDPAKDKAKVYKMIRDNRIRYFAPANYSDGSDLDMLVKTIIDRTVKNEAIESTYFACRKEQIEEDKKSTEEGKEKRDLILQLEESRSFATTHAIIDKLRRITSWTQDECDDLIDIAIQNSQVYYILNDSDVRKFYEKILKENKKTTANSKKLEELFGE